MLPEINIIKNEAIINLPTTIYVNIIWKTNVLYKSTNLSLYWLNENIVENFFDQNVHSIGSNLHTVIPINLHHKLYE